MEYSRRLESTLNSVSKYSNFTVKLLGFFLSICKVLFCTKVGFRILPYLLEYKLHEVRHIYCSRLMPIMYPSLFGLMKVR